MEKVLHLNAQLCGRLDAAGHWIAFLLLRLLLAWEFGSAGLKKLRGDNWFGSIQDNFPFPFSIIPVEISWFIATWAEILGALGLLLGLFTRFWAFSLIILSVVAIAGVHWPDEWGSLAELWKGYAVTDKGFGNYRIPLLFIAMLIPLGLSGPGRFSIDHILARRLDKSHALT